MEETIGYEALFSPEEWDSMSGNRETSGHGVTINYPPGELEGNEDALRARLRFVRTHRSRRHAAVRGGDSPAPRGVRRGAGGELRGAGMSETQAPILGDLVIVLLASTLAGLRDRLEEDGFTGASELVAGLTEPCDALPRRRWVRET